MQPPTPVQRYEAFMNRQLQQGANLAEYDCPRCTESLHARVPEGEKSHSTFTQCPYCNGRFMWQVTKTGEVFIKAEPTDRYRKASQ